MVKYENPTPAHTTTPAAPMQNTQADVQTDGKQTGTEGISPAGFYTEL